MANSLTKVRRFLGSSPGFSQSEFLVLVVWILAVLVLACAIALALL